MADQKSMAIVPDIMPAGTAIEAMSRAELDVQISTAKAYPRDIARFRKRVLELATLSQDIAESCFYAIPREGKIIEGPSVRLAEIIASSYQNIRAGARIVEISPTHVTAQGVCHDLENNFADSLEVKRSIVGKRGRYSNDMITVTSQAACSIAFRNAILKVVPTTLLKDVYDQIKAVGLGNERTLTDRRSAVLNYFKGMNIDEKRLLAAVEAKSVEGIGLEEVARLRMIAQAIKDGEIGAEEAFPVERKAGQATPGSGGDLLRKAASKPDAPESPESDSDSPTGELPDGEQFDLSEPPACPKCGQPMEKKKNKQSGHEFWGCSGYPGCKQTLEIDEQNAEGRIK